MAITNYALSLDVDERFWSKTKYENPDSRFEGCIIWQAGKDKDGYGQFWADGYTRRAYKWIYERMMGSIPEGLQLDHLCKNRACVNPAHLEPVTSKVNIQRGDRAHQGWQSYKTHCIEGHEFNSENTGYYLRNGRKHRYCRICHRASRRKWYANGGYKKK